MFPNPSWLTLKNHLFNAHVPQKSTKSLGENAMGDKKAEFRKERLFRRVAQIHISKTSHELAGVGFFRLWRTSNFPPHMCNILFRVIQR